MIATMPEAPEFTPASNEDQAQPEADNQALEHESITKLREDLDGLMQQYNQLLSQFKASPTAENLDSLTFQGEEVSKTNDQIIGLLQPDPEVDSPEAGPYIVLQQHLEEQLGKLEVQRNRFVNRVKNAFNRPIR